MPLDVEEYSMPGDDVDTSEPEDTVTEGETGGAEDDEAIAPELLDQSPEGEVTPEGEVKPETVEGDGKTLPNDVKQALAQIKATNPAAAGKLRDSIFEVRSYRGVFPTLAEAEKARDFVQGIGGEEGLNGLRSQLEESAGLQQKYTEAPAELVKTLAENPEAFKQFAPAVINEWASKDPAAYSYLQNSLVVDAMAKAGFTLDAIAGEHNAPDTPPETKRILAMMYNTLDGMQKKASDFKTTQTQRNPEREKLEADRKAFEESRQSEFEKDLSTKTDTYTRDKADPWLKQYIGDQQLPEGVTAAINRELIVEVGTRLASIPGLDARLESLVKTRNTQEALVAVQQQVDKVIQAATKTVVERYTRTAGTQSKPAVPGKPRVATPVKDGAPARNAGTLKLSGPPKHGQIDWGKTQQMDFLQGSGVLKDGRRVSW